HEKLLKTADKVSVGGDLKIYPSRTQDAKKNPLPPDTKISYMRKMFPDFGERIINDPNMKTIFDVLIAANAEGYQNVNLVVGSDRQSEFENLAQKYNGDLYTFDIIRVVSAGVRDADSEGVEGMSASKMRKAVMDNDFASFRKGTPKTLDDGDTQKEHQRLLTTEIRKHFLMQFAKEWVQRNQNLKRNHIVSGRLLQNLI
ncbi:MAG: cytidyltransferase, partial [Microbacteriaceae bacterium]|nr:cytidyltransferase [Microbacteriaceae bacterium]